MGVYVLQYQDQQNVQVSTVLANSNIKLVADGRPGNGRTVHFRFSDDNDNLVIPPVISNVDLILGTAYVETRAPSKPDIYKVRAYYPGAKDESCYLFVIDPAAVPDNPNQDSGSLGGVLDTVKNTLKNNGIWIGLAVVLVWILIFSMPDKN